MITNHSIDLTKISGQCFADTPHGCTAMTNYDENCGNYKCPFFKPKECKTWIRIEDKQA